MPSSGPPKSTRVGLRGTSLFEFWKWARKGSYSLPPPGSYMRGLPRFGLTTWHQNPLVIECFTVGKVLTLDPPQLPDELHRTWKLVRPSSAPDQHVYMEHIGYVGPGVSLYLTAMPTNWVIEEEEEWSAIPPSSFRVQDMANRVRSGRVTSLDEVADFFKSLGVHSYEERGAPVVL